MSELQTMDAVIKWRDTQEEEGVTLARMPYEWRDKLDPNTGVYEGECDKCNDAYDLSDRTNRCGECGNCNKCCTHEREGK